MILPIPGIREPAQFSAPFMYEEIQNLLTVKIMGNDVVDWVKSSDGPLAKCNAILDAMGYNPGIVSVAVGELEKGGNIQMRFANQWHATSVTHRLLAHKERDFYVQIGSQPLYAFTKPFFSDRT